MVEVYAEILRGPGSSVYLTGEEVECEITFKNLNESTTTTTTTTSTVPVDRTKNKSTATDPKQQPSSVLLTTNTLAWACAQISCQCYLNESKVLLPKPKANQQQFINAMLTGTTATVNNSNMNSAVIKDSDNLENQGTSFLPNIGENGIIVYSSKPKILFCDLKLDSNSSKSFIYKEKIPYDLPPSYKGQYVKYLYKITIGIQKLNCGTQLLRIPFRVIAIKDFQKQLARYKIENPLHTDEPPPAPHADHNISPKKDDDIAHFTSNPFSIVEKHKEENLEFILEILQELTAKRNSYVYSITSTHGKVVKLTLLKLDYKIGDEIIGMLDFSDCDIACAEYMVTLTSEEIISDECKKKQNQTNFNETYSFSKEFVLFIKNTCFTLQVPVLATPAFNTDIVSLKWRLNFDFMISSTSKIQTIDSTAGKIDDESVQDTVWEVPNILNTEKMSWSLPINVHPTSPLILSNVCGNTEINRLVV